MSKRFKRLQGALKSTQGDWTRSLRRALGPEARNAEGGPQGRAGPGAQPALLPRPRGPARGPRGRGAPQEPAVPRSAAATGHPPARPAAPSVPAAAAQTSTSPPPRPERPASAASWPPAPLLQPQLGRRPSSGHTGLGCARLPERALRPAARRAAGAGLAQNGGRPLLESAGGGTPSKTELACWPGGLEALVGSKAGRSHSRGPEEREARQGRASPRQPSVGFGAFADPCLSVRFPAAQRFAA